MKWTAGIATAVTIALLVPFFASSARAADHSASMEGNTFLPPEVSIDIGDSVTWTNKDQENHTVVGEGVESPEIQPGETFTQTFATQQEFHYSCRLHPYMEGVVKAGIQSTPSSGTEPGAPMHHAAPVAPTPIPSPTPIRAVKARANPPVGADLGDGTRLATYTVDKSVKVFQLRMAPMQLEVSKGVIKQAFAFNGIVPGPVIRVNEGDRVRIIVTNDLPISTAVHWHGMILPNDQDGVPHITQHPIGPGETYTYEWTALAPGSHWYHTHSARSHIGKGLYGSLEVVPRKGDILSDHDYRILIGDTDLGMVFNGRSYPATVNLKARVGERVRIRLIGTGEQSHPIHLHGQPFDLVAQDGFRLPAPVRMDTLLVSTGQTFDILTVPLINSGKWLLHCHIFGHSHLESGELKDGHEMTGLVTLLDVAPAPAHTPTPLRVPNLASAKTGVVATRTASRGGPPLELLLLVAALVLLAARSVRKPRTTRSR